LIEKESPRELYMLKVLVPMVSLVSFKKKGGRLSHTSDVRITHRIQQNRGDS
jgi:hypothetical protein